MGIAIAEFGPQRDLYRRPAVTKRLRAEIAKASRHDLADAARHLLADAREIEGRNAAGDRLALRTQLGQEALVYLIVEIAKSGRFAVGIAKLEAVRTNSATQRTIVRALAEMRNKLRWLDRPIRGRHNQGVSHYQLTNRMIGLLARYLELLKKRRRRGESRYIRTQFLQRDTDPQVAVPYGTGYSRAVPNDSYPHPEAVPICPDTGGPARLCPFCRRGVAHPA